MWTGVTMDRSNAYCISTGMLALYEQSFSYKSSYCFWVIEELQQSSWFYHDAYPRFHNISKSLIIQSLSFTCPACMGATSYTMIQFCCWIIQDSPLSKPISKAKDSPHGGIYCGHSKHIRVKTYVLVSDTNKAFLDSI